MRRTTADVRYVRRLRYEFGLTYPEVQALTGVSATFIAKYAPGWPGKVSNAALREAFEESAVTAADVARHLGWWEGGHADTSRVRRMLGVSESRNGRDGSRSRRAAIDAEVYDRVRELFPHLPWSREMPTAGKTR